MYRWTGGSLEVLLAHMGGPYFRNRDAGAWTVPKGEYEDPEPALAAARREFREELGLPPPDGELLDLGSARQSGGKLVTVWAVRGDLDPDRIEPGTFELHWPPRSGVLQTFPEVDRVQWFDPTSAYERLVTGQRVFLGRLVQALPEPG